MTKLFTVLTHTLFLAALQKCRVLSAAWFGYRDSLFTLFKAKTRSRR